jgi:hypothetical protein
MTTLTGESFFPSEFSRGSGSPQPYSRVTKPYPYDEIDDLPAATNTSEQVTRMTAASRQKGGAVCAFGVCFANLPYSVLGKCSARTVSQIITAGALGIMMGPKETDSLVAKTTGIIGSAVASFAGLKLTDFITSNYSKLIASAAQKFAVLDTGKACVPVLSEIPMAWSLGAIAIGAIGTALLTKKIYKKPAADTYFENMAYGATALNFSLLAFGNPTASQLQAMSLTTGLAFSIFGKKLSGALGGKYGRKLGEYISETKPYKAVKQKVTSIYEKTVQAKEAIARTPHRVKEATTRLYLKAKEKTADAIISTTKFVFKKLILKPTVWCIKQDFKTYSKLFRRIRSAQK